MARCNARHPEQALACVASDDSGTRHDRHYAMVADEPVEWANESYVPPPVKTRSSAATNAERLRRLAEGVPPKVVRGDHFTKAEGMQASLVCKTTEEFRAVFLAALREVAQARETVTSDDVWDLLLGRGFQYSGSRQAVGPMMSKTAVSNGWTVPTGEKVEPRHDFGHSGLDIRVYRSRVFSAST